MQPPYPLSANGRLGRWLLVLGGVVVLACLFTGAISLVHARRDTWDRERTATRNLHLALQGEIARIVESFDLSLQAVRDNLHVPGVAELPPQLRRLVLFDRAAEAKHLGSIRVLDAEGQTIIDSRSLVPRPGNFAGRDYFEAHVLAADRGLYISKPFRTRVRHHWVVAFSRRLNTAEGEFNGVVVGTLVLSYLQQRFAEMSLGKDGVIALFRDDGVLLMRSPLEEAQLGRDVTRSDRPRRTRNFLSGQFVEVGRLDGVERLFTAGPVAGAPLRLTVGTATREIEWRWLGRGLLIAGTTLVMLMGLLALAVLLWRELARRQVAEREARESEGRFRLLAENSRDMVTRIGPDGVRRYVSPAVRRLLGRTPEDMLGRNAQDGIHPADLPPLAEALARLRSGAAEEAVVQYRGKHAAGHEVWLESTLQVVRLPPSGQRDGVVAVTRDISERKALEARLERHASQDGLTGLGNRRSFDEALPRHWEACRQRGLPLSVLLADVDHFKRFNDTYGHPAGDACLRQVAAVIEASIRGGQDLAARYGGEEFVVLLPGVNSEDAATIAERLRAALAALALPHADSGLPGCVVTASIGCATTFPVLEPGAPETLVARADAALYAAKLAGRNRVALAEALTPEAARS